MPRRAVDPHEAAAAKAGLALPAGASRSGGAERDLGHGLHVDQLFDGRPIRILTIVDIHTREALSTHPRANFRAAQVVEILDGLVRLRGKPKSLRVDNGPEFAGRLLDHWAYLNGVEIDFSRPGKPTDTDVVEQLSLGRACYFLPAHG
jgi:transposase InsO family protein